MISQPLKMNFNRKAIDLASRTIDAEISSFGRSGQPPDSVASRDHGVHHACCQERM